MVAWAQIVAGLVSAGTAAPTDPDALELYAGGNLTLYGGGVLDLYGEHLQLYGGGNLELYAGGALELYSAHPPFNAILDTNGEPILDTDGQYILGV